ncbi:MULTISPECIES: phage tail protein [Microbacterium]|uniref:Phage tail protein n=1 Tax=Microbacterium wangchenii TaxID=2541726 RepID=A0ABX5SSQ2_9MICO|nr:MULTISPECIES: phage tail protein [Microbacterium]MCK6067926.1 phage tail protein [Microbacterium sp. EYE_512]QBR89190.1 phage tail protein [Microbacterium wangchenii]TFV81755.1 phage tail protein [Microbacterium sp. dk485]TXK10859.1 phage tail protein [Microbacterium wangchenii]
MRGVIPGLGTPAPLLDRLPGILQDDDFLQRFLPAFDATVAPVYAVLDSLPAYIDPFSAPADFLEWLAGWVDVELDQNWPLEQRRRFIAEAATLHRLRGTATGIRHAVSLAAGPAAEVTVTDGGGVWIGTVPDPAAPEQRVRIVVASTVPLEEADRARLARAAAASVPAHLLFDLEVELVPVSG